MTVSSPSMVSSPAITLIVRVGSGFGGSYLILLVAVAPFAAAVTVTVPGSSVRTSWEVRDTDQVPFLSVFVRLVMSGLLSLSASSSVTVTTVPAGRSVDEPSTVTVSSVPSMLSSPAIVLIVRVGSGMGVGSSQAVVRMPAMTSSSPRVRILMCLFCVGYSIIVAKRDLFVSSSLLQAG